MRWQERFFSEDNLAACQPSSSAQLPVDSPRIDALAHSLFTQKGTTNDHLLNLTCSPNYSPSYIII